jgi:apolipoprotein N-acyltransferase
VGVIQPNYDCYAEKFQYNAQTGQQNTDTYVPFPQQVENFVELSRAAAQQKASFVAWPETALHQSVLVANAMKYPQVKRIYGFLDSLGHDMAVVSGMDTYVTTPDEKAATENARYRDDLGYYDVYSSAVRMQAGRQPDFYHKSQLVIGVETIPFRQLFTALIMNFGGTSGGLSVQKEREVLYGPDSLAVAAAICYESIFGEYVTEYIAKGAQAIFVITNDGWWGDTPGARQHWRFAKLRAIECRRPIARSANTGISGFIDAKGDELARTEYGVRTEVFKKVLFSQEMTFYARNGDVLGRLAAFFAVAFLLSAIVRSKVAKSVLFR